MLVKEFNYFKRLLDSEYRYNLITTDNVIRLFNEISNNSLELHVYSQDMDSDKVFHNFKLLCSYFLQELITNKHMLKTKTVPKELNYAIEQWRSRMFSTNKWPITNDACNNFTYNFCIEVVNNDGKNLFATKMLISYKI